MKKTNFILFIVHIGCLFRHAIPDFTLSTVEDDWYRLKYGEIVVYIKMETVEDKAVYIVIKVENILNVRLGFKPGTF